MTWRDKLGRTNALVLLGCLVAHGGLLALLLIHMVQSGSGGRSTLLQISSYLSMPATTTPQTPKPKSIIVIEPPLELPPPPPLDLNLAVIPEPAEVAPQPAQTSAANAPATTSSSSGYDDPYAGAAVDDYRGAAANAAPLLQPSPPTVPPKLDEKRWQSVIAALKRSKPQAHSLALLAQIDPQGRILDCQVIGGDAPPALQQSACALLRGKILFGFDATPTESQWRTLPEIIF
jgi:hypothetical protein